MDEELKHWILYNKALTIDHTSEASISRNTYHIKAYEQKEFVNDERTSPPATLHSHGIQPHYKH